MVVLTERSGGSVLAELLSKQYGNIQASDLSTTIRSTEQANALSKLGMNVFQVDLNDEASLTDVVVRNESELF